MASYSMATWGHRPKIIVVNSCHDVPTRVLVPFMKQLEEAVNKDGIGDGVQLILAILESQQVCESPKVLTLY